MIKTRKESEEVYYSNDKVIGINFQVASGKKKNVNIREITVVNQREKASKINESK